MNVTKDGFKDRQLHMEDYLQMIPAEQGKYAGVSVYQRMEVNVKSPVLVKSENLDQLHATVKLLSSIQVGEKSARENGWLSVDEVEAELGL